jgi:hypothetical protein
MAAKKAAAAKKATVKKAEKDEHLDQLGTKETDGSTVEMSTEEEVAARSQDITDADTSDAFVKDFVVPGYGWDESVDQDETHRANLEATRQYLIHQGLRPTADGSFVGATDHPDGVSVILTYSVPAVPAHEALEVTGGDLTVAHAHVTLDDQHDAEKVAAEK